MKENDKLQLIDPEMIGHVAGLDADGMWQLTLERLDQLRRLEKFDSPALYGLSYGGMEHFEKCFWRFYKEDADHVKWGLIHDLGFLGKPVRIDPWAASGYLDSASSAGVPTSRDLIPEWDEDSDAHYSSCLFDVLDADHLDLIAKSLKRFENLFGSPPAGGGVDAPRGRGGGSDEPATGLQVKTMAKTIRNNPTLRAAYIYQEHWR